MNTNKHEKKGTIHCKVVKHACICQVKSCEKMIRSKLCFMQDILVFKASTATTDVSEDEL